MRMQVGTELADGRYTLRERLKRTGMAEVWLAEQRGMHGFSKTVIVKMIHPDLSEQHEAKTRFFDEARFASKIRHPNVVEIYDFGEEDGIFYLVMEYIQGYDLEALVEKCKERGAKIPIPFICRLIADSAKGLQVIHALRDDRGQSVELVHRDISPQNLVVASSGVIKIIDFGVVKAREKSSRTRTGVIVGKLQYMSPEQLSSEELDARSDVFSLGLVLFELLTLEPRFRGTNLLEIFYEALNEPMPDVASKRNDCPLDVVDCVKLSLAQKKADRFQSAQEMQRALESHLIQQGIAVTESDIAGYLAQVFGDGRIGFGEADQATGGDATMMAPPAHAMQNVGPAMMGGRAPSHTISAQPPKSDDDDPEMQRIRQALGPAANASIGGSHTFDSRSSGGSHTFDSRSAHTMEGAAIMSQRSPQTPPMAAPPAISTPQAPSYGGSPFSQMEPSYRPAMGAAPANFGGGEATVVLDTEQLGETNDATVVFVAPSSEALMPISSGIPPSAMTSFGNEPTGDLSGTSRSSRDRGYAEQYMASAATPVPASYGREVPGEVVSSQRTVIGAYPQKPKSNMLWLWILLGALTFGGGLLVVYLMVG